jgi:serine/threonine protein kinase
MSEQHSKHKLKLSSKLGSGAFGLVHKGTYDGSEVAVKTLGPKHAGNRDSQRLFFKEARVLQEISHP